MPVHVMILPRKARFQIDRIGPTLCNFTYEEYVEPKFKKMMKQTIALGRKLFEQQGLVVKATKNGLGVRISGKKIPFRNACSLVTGEFINWTPLGDLTIRDLFGVVTTQAAVAAGGTPIPKTSLTTREKAFAVANKENGVPSPELASLSQKR